VRLLYGLRSVFDGYINASSKVTPRNRPKNLSIVDGINPEENSKNAPLAKADTSKQSLERARKFEKLSISLCSLYRDEYGVRLHTEQVYGAMSGTIMVCPTATI